MENSSTSKLVTAFVLVIIGISLLAQIASIGLTVTDLTRGTTETIDVSDGLTNESTVVNFTVHLINNITNVSVPTYGKEISSYYGMTVYNATSGVQLDHDFVVFNFSIDGATGALDHITATSIWNDTDVNISYGVIAYQVNTSYQIIPTVVATAASTWRSDVSECTAGTIIEGSYANASGTVLGAGNYSVDTTTGYITLVNTAMTNRTDFTSIIATNDNCPDGYLTQGWQRQMINLVPGFFALAILGVGLWLFYGIAKEQGILGI